MLTGMLPFAKAAARLVSPKLVALSSVVARKVWFSKGELVRLLRSTVVFRSPLLARGIRSAVRLKMDALP